MHSSNSWPHFTLKVVTAVLVPLTLWLALRGYHGLVGDAQLYAVQALSRIHPQLASDLYLQNTSQDQFTIFSPIYSRFIASMGVEQAARFLTLAFKLWFMLAAWIFVRTLTNARAAWLALCALIIVPGIYGGSGVFQFSDQFLTARLPAEAMIATSLAFFARDQRLLSIVMAIVALLIHPLMALPGLLLSIALLITPRTAAVAAVAGVLGTLCLAIAAAQTTLLSTTLPLMDPAWLEVVQERSQFLFLRLWAYRDWELNLRPFFVLALAALSTRNPRVQNLCFAAGLVGVCGLVVAAIAGAVGPVAFLVQGQAWRWVWISAFVAIALLPSTAMSVWQEPKCGPLCSLLLVSGWSISAVDGTACVSLAMVIWLMRNFVSQRQAIVLRLAFTAACGAILVWLTMRSYRLVALPGTNFAAIVRGFLDLRISAALLVAVIFLWLRKSRHFWQLLLPPALLVVFCIVLGPGAFKQSREFGLKSDIDAFAEWRKAIPPTSTVIVLPPRDVGSFVWFTLERPNFLTVDQSAGVVFSRATALEVKRRSEVLLPVMEPNWKIRTHLQEKALGRPQRATTPTFTADTLRHVCRDPLLGFVIASPDVGFQSLRHLGEDMWKDWNLYDCQNLR